MKASELFLREAEIVSEFVDEGAADLLGEAFDVGRAGEDIFAIEIDLSAGGGAHGVGTIQGDANE